MKCACCVQMGICQPCWDALVSWTPNAEARRNARLQAERYSKLGRRQRVALGETYARPMPVAEYIYQIKQGSEAV